MSRDSEVKNEVALMKNLWRILAMTGGACFITIVLAMMSSMIKWSDMAALKVFIFALVAVTGVFSIVSLITACISVYFRITALSEENFRVKKKG